MTTPIDSIQAQDTKLQQTRFLGRQFSYEWLQMSMPPVTLTILNGL